MCTYEYVTVRVPADATLNPQNKQGMRNKTNPSTCITGVNMIKGIDSTALRERTRTVGREGDSENKREL